MSDDTLPPQVTFDDLRQALDNGLRFRDNHLLAAARHQRVINMILSHARAADDVDLTPDDDILIEFGAIKVSRAVREYRQFGLTLARIEGQAPAVAYHPAGEGDADRVLAGLQGLGEAVAGLETRIAGMEESPAPAAQADPAIGQALGEILGHVGGMPAALDRLERRVAGIEERDGKAPPSGAVPVAEDKLDRLIAGFEAMAATVARIDERVARLEAAPAKAPRRQPKERAPVAQPAAPVPPPPAPPPVAASAPIASYSDLVAGLDDPDEEAAPQPLPPSPPAAPAGMIRRRPDIKEEPVAFAIFDVFERAPSGTRLSFKQVLGEVLVKWTLSQLPRGEGEDEKDVLRRELQGPQGRWFEFRDGLYQLGPIAYDQE